MMPPQTHDSIHWLSRVGVSANKTVGAPGTQGASVTGIQGMGVSTPSAAAVAAATAGFAGETHIPNGMMLTIGSLSMIVASGWSPVLTRLTGKTTKVAGARPKLHWRVAPLHTCCAMLSPFAGGLPCTALLDSSGGAQSAR